ncbi:MULTISPECIES: MFS transporter [Staphylococcus]|uniref:MFS transporter n=1 Tax=Staphylococcus TaxID=1279 RepID=UPI0018854DE5|nr:MULTISPECIES: MFS transporter [Staphylococcus]MBO0376710.1 MFS transporter [Staphylococcus warneri]QOX59944.1 MFS transporter [Staphylococcus capitis]
MLKLFYNKNFSIIFSGRLLTNLGDSLYFIITMWLVFDLTHSEFYTGLAGFLLLLPETLQFLIGPIVNNYSPKLILIFVQIFQGILMLIIPILYNTNTLNIYLLLLLIFISSTINQFNYPIHNILLPKILSYNDLTKGNSLLTVAYQGTDIPFNALSGLLLSITSAISLYLYNFFAFIFTGFIFSFLSVSFNTSKKKKFNINDYYNEIIDSFKFVFSTIIFKIFLGLIVLNFTSGIIMAILPIYSNIKGGPLFYGYYLSCMSIGVLLGAFASNFLDRFPLGKLHIVMFFISFLSLFSSTFFENHFNFVLFLITWIPFGVTNVISISTAQRLLDEDNIAKVYTIINSVGVIAMPIGSLFSGIISTYIGPNNIMILSSILFLFVTFIWITIHDLRNLPQSKNVKL